MSFESTYIHLIYKYICEYSANYAIFINMPRKMISRKMPTFFGTTQSDSDCAVQMSMNQSPKNQKNASQIYKVCNRFCLCVKSDQSLSLVGFNTYTFELCDKCNIPFPIIVN